MITSPGPSARPADADDTKRPPADAAPDPHWYRSAVIYQLHVRSFCDSTGDGVGDFNGLISRLDYLADLGVTALWLQPFYPSPLRDDGYDIAEYTSVHPAYGHIDDFRRFVQEAHLRGLRVITELVINHTSDQHEWFQRARRAPKGSPEREYYVWSDTAERFREARIIFKDFERSNWTWDPVAGQYFWHRFYSHQPDLNFDNPAVRRAVLDICDFWMETGVDGVRLDAIPYLYEREGTGCENLPETHEFLRTLRAHVDARWPGRMLLAEANQWPEDAVAYFGRGDECHMAFHFPVMPRLFMAVRMEDRFPITDILEQTPAIPPACQWAMFLRNHDELTLEMVTDEERDYMYRVYASDPQARINLGIRRRLAPLLSNNRRKIELMNALLFSMPGTPIIYYGDEIGMGDNVHLGDRNGVRTPMQWSADRNGGFSRANPQGLFLPAIIDPEYHFEAVNVEAQLGNSSSLLWWMRRLIALRKRYPVFGAGEVRFLHPSNPHVLAFTRRDQHHTILVVANLSRFVQPVEIPLAEHAGRHPVELFGRIPFPAITSSPYFLSLGPHAFFWFLLESAPAAPSRTLAETAPPLLVDGPWESIWASESLRRSLEQHLPSIVQSRRWFTSNTRGPSGATIRERLRLPGASPASPDARLFIAAFDFARGEPETYALPLTLEPEPASPRPPADEEPAAVVRLRKTDGESRRLIDAMTKPDFARTLLRIALTGEDSESHGTRIIGIPTTDPVDPAALEALPAVPLRPEQRNSTIIFDERYVLKLFRRLDEGENPESEIGRHLASHARFSHVAPLLGAVELHINGVHRRTLAVVHQYVPSLGDAWSWMLERAVKYLERAATLPEAALHAEPAASSWLVCPLPPPGLKDLYGQAVEASRLLGVRAAELHAALSTAGGDAAFEPEPFTPMYQRAMYQSIRNSVRAASTALARGADALPPDARAMADTVVRGEASLPRTIAAIRQQTLKGQRIRIHGDFHLEQILRTGKDLAVIDFEGNPRRSIGERRIKRSPLRDVAGMVRSFEYAAWAALDRYQELVPGAREGAVASLTRAARAWSDWTARTFTCAYFERINDAAPALLGPDPAEHELLLRAWILEQVCHEIAHELEHRPAWAHIPLRAAVAFLQ